MKGCHLTCGRRGNTSPTSSNPGKTNTDLKEAKNKNKAKQKTEGSDKLAPLPRVAGEMEFCGALAWPHLQLRAQTQAPDHSGGHRKQVPGSEPSSQPHSWLGSPCPAPAAMLLASGSRKPQKTFQIKPACSFNTQPKCRRPSQAKCSCLSFKH